MVFFVGFFFNLFLGHRGHFRSDLVWPVLYVHRTGSYTTWIFFQILYFCYIYTHNKKNLKSAVWGFAEKTPGGGFFFFSASLKSAEGKICKYVPPTQPKLNILKQIKKYYLKYRYFIYICQVISIIFKKLGKSPRGWVFFFFSARLDEKWWKKTPPPGVFSAKPLYTVFADLHTTHFQHWLEFLIHSQLNFLESGV